MGDERLVARVRAGDDDAFEAIYDRYYLGLLAFCRHMLGSRQEAEDALQHSFASAYRALRAGNSAVDLRPWLYTIARNRCLSALRSRREELDIDGVDLASGSFEGLPVQIQVRTELRELVEDLQRLPDDQRAALVLFELGDHSHDEIAAVLDVRREKVKALVFQARSGLLRARRARDASCAEVREQIASLVRGLPKRGLVRAHVDRCEACAQFEREVRRQRSALAAILPVVPSAGLKATVLGFALGGGGGAAAITGATAGGGVAVGGAAALGTAGVATVAGGIVTGTTNVGGGFGALSAKGLMTKLLTVVAVAGGGGEATHSTPQAVNAAPAAVTMARDSLAERAPDALTARRQAAATHVSHPPQTRRSPHGPPDPSLPLSVPAPETAQADVAPVAAPQRPIVQPAAPAPTPAPTAAADAAPAPAPAIPDPGPTPAPETSDPAPAPADTTATAPTTPSESTPAVAPAETATTSTDAGATATTLSAPEAPPAATAPAAAATDAQS